MDHNPLHWRHNGRDGVSYHQPYDCLLNRLFGRRSKKTSKPRVTGLCVGNSPGFGEFPAQMASNAENVSIWWRHHAEWIYRTYPYKSPMKFPVISLFKVTYHLNVGGWVWGVEMNAIVYKTTISSRSSSHLYTSHLRKVSVDKGRS